MTRLFGRIAALAAGLRASLDGEEAKLSVTQMQQAMTAFQQEMQTKLTARRNVSNRISEQPLVRRLATVRRINLLTKRVAKWHDVSC